VQREGALKTAIPRSNPSGAVSLADINDAKHSFAPYFRPKLQLGTEKRGALLPGRMIGVMYSHSLGA